MSRNQILIVKFSLVILMTSFFGCAIFSKNSNQTEDPILREAMRIREQTEGPLMGGADFDRDQAEHKMRSEDEIQFGMETHEVVLGMSMNQVVAIWGSPRNIETAGSFGIGNQKWTYRDGFLSRWNLKSSRIVYFEAGKVAGWETAY